MSSRVPDAATRPAPFFDHGLFLLHLNRGREEMRKGQYEEARREFEGAQRFRPHDPEVLSNLSFALFHLGLYDESERMTRELLTSHADSVPLLFNLGLVLFKSGRGREAEAPLRRVIELAPNHRKAHLTLGLVLQRLGEATLARQHFRSAGAELKAGTEEDDTVSRTARAAAAADRAAGTGPIVKPESLEGFTRRPEPARERAAEPRLEPKPEPATPPPQPVGPRTLVPPPPVTVFRPVAVEPTGPYTPKAGGFVTADCRPGVWVRRGVLTGRSGSPAFEPDQRLTGPLGKSWIKASGAGTVLLVERGRQPFFVALRDDFLSVDPARLLSFEATLAFREDPAFEFRRIITTPFLKLLGSGAVALAVVNEPARFDVEADNPFTVAAKSVLAYGGQLQPELLEDSDPLAELGSGPVLRFSGDGYVLTEA